MNKRTFIPAIAALALVLVGSACTPEEIVRAQRVVEHVDLYLPTADTEPPETFPPATCIPDTGTCQDNPTDPIAPAPTHVEGTTPPVSPCVPDTGTCYCVPDTGTCGTLPPPPENEPQAVNEVDPDLAVSIAIPGP